jgi:hypothetical protein
MRQFAILLFIFFSLTSQIFAQVRLSGYVTDAEGNRLELAAVQQKGTNHGTFTNAKGFYELDLLNPQDSVEIVFSYMGETVSRTVPSKKSISLDVKLQRKAIELGETEVRGIHIQTTMNELIDNESFRFIPNIDGITGVLSTFPGVQTTELSSQYSVRGGSYDENIVYVNDIEIYRPLLIRAGQQEGLSFINTDMVESVSFSAGGFEAKFGDKMSSVLDIKYKKPKELEGSVSISLLGASAYVGSSSKKFSQIHGFRYKTSGYLLGTLDSKGEYKPNFLDYQTYLNYKIAPKWEASFLGNFSQNKYEFIPKTRETTFGTMDNIRNFVVHFDGHEQDLFRTFFGAFTLNFKPISTLNLSIIASAFHTNEEETYDITGEYWLSELADESEGSVAGIGSYHEHARNKLKATVVNLSHQGNWEKRWINLKWGLSYQQERIFDKISEWEMRDSAGYSIAAPPLLGYDLDRKAVELYNNLSGNNTLDTYRVQAFVQESYKYNWNFGSLSAVLGIRANYWSFNKEFLVSPRLSLAFVPTWKNNFVFRFATGMYYQAPFYKELRYNERDENGNNIVMLNKDVKAQKTVHFVFGTDYYFRAWGRPFKLTAEAYYKNGIRLMPYIVDNVRIRYLSKEETNGYTTGVDLKLFGEMLPGTDSWIGFSWMQSREAVKGVNDHGVEIDYGYIPRPNEQRYSISLFFQDYFPTKPKYKMHLKLVWADGLPFGPPNSERQNMNLRTPPYRRVDIGASRILVNGKDKMMSKSIFKYVKSIWLTVEVFNLINIRNVNSYYWVTDVNNVQYAVPNYLTSRQFNVKLTVDF